MARALNELWMAILASRRKPETRMILSALTRQRVISADEEALSWLTTQSQQDTKSGSDTNVRQMADPTSAVNINMGTLVGSYASVARMLDEVAAVPGAEGVLLTFDDFLTGVETFGERIQPLMQCRAHIPAVTKEVA